MASRDAFNKFMSGVLRLRYMIWPIARRDVEHRLNELEKLPRFQDMPAFLNAVSSVGAFGFELQQFHKALDRQGEEMGRLWERVEFVRREVLYEMKYGSNGTAAPERIEARIVQPEKLAEATSNGLRLNLGCGHVALDGYINVDQRALPGVDIVSDIGDVPVPEASAREVFSSHVLEHVPQEELRRRLLPYWRGLLARNGAFRAIVPDGEAMLAGYADGTYPFDEFREVLFGAQDYEGDFHYNLFTAASLTALLEEAGFVNIEVPVKGRRNGKCFEFEIRATRP